MGLGGLIGAVICLVGIIRFPGVLPDALMFKLFFGSFGFALATFFVNRVAEIGLIAVRTPDPRTLRRDALATGTVQSLKSGDAHSRDLPRAA